MSSKAGNKTSAKTNSKATALRPSAKHVDATVSPAGEKESSSLAEHPHRSHTPVGSIVPSKLNYLNEPHHLDNSCDGGEPLNMDDHESLGSTSRSTSSEQGGMTTTANTSNAPTMNVPPSSLPTTGGSHYHLRHAADINNSPGPAGGQPGLSPQKEKELVPHVVMARLKGIVSDIMDMLSNPMHAKEVDAFVQVTQESLQDLKRLKLQGGSKSFRQQSKSCSPPMAVPHPVLSQQQLIQQQNATENTAQSQQQESGAATTEAAEALPPHRTHSSHAGISLPGTNAPPTTTTTGSTWASLVRNSTKQQQTNNATKRSAGHATDDTENKDSNKEKDSSNKSRTTAAGRGSSLPEHDSKQQLRPRSRDHHSKTMPAQPSAAAAKAPAPSVTTTTTTTANEAEGHILQSPTTTATDTPDSTTAFLTIAGGEASAETAPTTPPTTTAVIKESKDKEKKEEKEKEKDTKEGSVREKKEADKATTKHSRNTTSSSSKKSGETTEQASKQPTKSRTTAADKSSANNNKNKEKDEAKGKDKDDKEKDSKDNSQMATSANKDTSNNNTTSAAGTSTTGTQATAATESAEPVDHVSQRLQKAVANVARQGRVAVEQYQKESELGVKELNRSRFRLLCSRLTGASGPAVRQLLLDMTMHLKPLDHEYCRYFNVFDSVVPLMDDARRKSNFPTFRLCSDFLHKMLMDPSEGSPNVRFFVKAGHVAPLLQMIHDEVRAMKDNHCSAYLTLCLSLLQYCLTCVIQQSAGNIRFVPIRDQLIDLMGIAGMEKMCLSLVTTFSDPCDMPGLQYVLLILHQQIVMTAKRKSDGNETYSATISALFVLFQHLTLPPTTPAPGPGNSTPKTPLTYSNNNPNNTSGGGNLNNSSVFSNTSALNQSGKRRGSVASDGSNGGPNEVIGHRILVIYTAFRLLNLIARLRFPLLGAYLREKEEARLHLAQLLQSFFTYLGGHRGSIERLPPELPKEGVAGTGLGSTPPSVSGNTNINNTNNGAGNANTATNTTGNPTGAANTNNNNSTANTAANNNNNNNNSNNNNSSKIFEDALRFGITTPIVPRSPIPTYNPDGTMAAAMSTSARSNLSASTSRTGRDSITSVSNGNITMSCESCTRAALHEVLLFIGVAATAEPSVQALFSTEVSPTTGSAANESSNNNNTTTSEHKPLLSLLLSAVDFQYFKQAKGVLFPTLIALTMNNKRNKELTAREMDFDSLGAYIIAELEALPAKQLKKVKSNEEPPYPVATPPATPPPAPSVAVAAAPPLPPPPPKKLNWADLADSSDDDDYVPTPTVAAAPVSAPAPTTSTSSAPSVPHASGESQFSLKEKMLAQCRNVAPYCQLFRLENRIPMPMWKDALADLCPEALDAMNNNNNNNNEQNGSSSEIPTATTVSS